MASHAPSHDPHLAHHFASAQQQFESAKLGMWLFLATEILLFGGLFCVYAVYRSNHPEVFAFGHQFLDTRLGALNTVILICSSFTVAWAVRAAQLKQIGLLRLMLALTLACAASFLGVKYVEYSHKWQHGLLWASRYHPDTHRGDEAANGSGTSSDVRSGATTAAPSDATPGDRPEGSNIAAAAAGPAGMAVEVEGAPGDRVTPEPANARLFFSIYFLMTGLHGIHVLGGMAAMLWLLVLAQRGAFDSGHFTRVDMVALYWHVVDLIWIYLFLLLYLID
jgi:cytochrome c oxidase subunit 3